MASFCASKYSMRQVTMGFTPLLSWAFSNKSTKPNLTFSIKLHAWDQILNCDISSIDITKKLICILHLITILIKLNNSNLSRTNVLWSQFYHLTIHSFQPLNQQILQCNLIKIENKNSFGKSNIKILWKFLGAKWGKWPHCVALSSDADSNPNVL